MRMPKEPAENYELRAGRATMVIDAANGARIMSLKMDTTELLSQNPMPNMYGSTFWTSPQKEWNWPPVREHDMGRYAVEQKQDGSLLMTSQVPERIPLRIAKEFRVQGDSFVITYSIKNMGTEARSVAPWEVTRVNGRGEIAFRADSIWPAGLMDFQPAADGELRYSIDQQDKQRKINANGRPMAGEEESYLTFRTDRLQLTKRFPNLLDGQAAPGEDEIQVYVHQQALYCELEEQGPYTLLQPGQELQWTVSWELTMINE